MSCTQTILMDDWCAIHRISSRSYRFLKEMTTSMQYMYLKGRARKEAISFFQIFPVLRMKALHRCLNGQNRFRGRSSYRDASLSFCTVTLQKTNGLRVSQCSYFRALWMLDRCGCPRRLPFIPWNYENIRSVTLSHTFFVPTSSYS